MHPLPSAHLSLQPYLNCVHPIVTPKTIRRSHSRLPVSPAKDNWPHAPLIYWRAVALTGVVCLALVFAGIVLAVGTGKRPPGQIEDRVDDAISNGAVASDAGDSSPIVNASAEEVFADDANVAPLTALNLTVASTPIVPATPLNPEPLDPFTDAAGDNPASAQRPTPAKAPPACKRYGTAVDFVDNPIDAATQALREKKLLFVLHVAGNFEEEKFT
jgi:hypothetical protein